MGNHFIREIEISKFKCFNNFKSSKLARVNLIGGKNNVGKTAFLEGIYINACAKNVNTLSTTVMEIKFMRDKVEYIFNPITIKVYKDCFENTKKYSSSSNMNKVDYELIDENGKKEYSFCINDKKIIVNANDFSHQIERINNIKYLDNFALSNSNLQYVYGDVQQKDKEQTLNKYINDFDERIESFKIIGENNPVCRLKGENNYFKINEFGDGLKHYISIICSLYSCSDGYMFIDEINNGIHYTMLDKLWEIILIISKEQNVQVFATTHDKECIASFNRVQKKLEDDDSLYFEMYRNIKKDIFIMRTLDDEQLEYELSNKERFRGE